MVVVCWGGGGGAYFVGFFCCWFWGFYFVCCWGFFGGFFINKNCGKCVRSWCDGSSDRSFMVDPLSYFSFQHVLYDWCNKGRGMCYHLCGMMHIKESLLLIRKSSTCESSGFPLSLSEWSLTICLMPYNRK